QPWRPLGDSSWISGDIGTLDRRVLIMACISQQTWKRRSPRAMATAGYASPSGASEVGAVDERVLARHRQLASLPDRQLQDQALRALRYELDLPADMRRREVLKRLRAWLLLDPSEASRLARAFDDAGSRLDDAERELVRETEDRKSVVYG